MSLRLAMSTCTGHIKEYLKIDQILQTRSYFERLKDDLRNRYGSPIPYSICCCATIILTLIGPFGTYGRATDIQLFLYWGGIVFWAALTSIFLSSLIRVSMKSPSIVATSLSTVLFTLTFTPFLIWFSDVVLGDSGGRRPSNLHLGLYVLIITSAVGGLIYQIEKHFKPAAPTGPRLWRRLPQALQTDVIRLSSDGHFVSVHTVSGVHRLRMRFADATAEMDNVAGGCVHRSHWIAQAHVKEVRSRNSRPLLVMSDGSEVPVSRTYRSEAERMRLLPAENKAAALQPSRQA